MAGGVALVIASLVALVWANSPWRENYESIWQTPIDLAVRNVGFTGDLRHFVNDGLMAVFFLVVGLEIKRELVVGELRHWRTAVFPGVAALGGMLVPAILYAAINAGGPGSPGWGIPIATDIAFALGVLALLGNRVPTSLKVFLLILAIVDDVGTFLLIAVFYSREVNIVAIAIACGIIGLLILLRWAGVSSGLVYLIGGLGLWLAVYKSGVHATMAGVALGLVVPATLPAQSGRALNEATNQLTDRKSMSERFAHRLHPLSSFAIVPLFALANAGVHINPSAFAVPGGTRVAAGVIVGRIVGKFVGITLAAWFTVRVRLCPPPIDFTWRQLKGTAIVAGVGFTIPLFITELAFVSGVLEPAAKLAILGASVLAGIGGVIYLRRAPPMIIETPGI